MLPRSEGRPWPCRVSSWRRAGRSRACRGVSWWQRDRRLVTSCLVRLQFCDPAGPVAAGFGGGLAAGPGTVGGMSYAAALGSGALSGAPGVVRTGLPGSQAAGGPGAVTRHDHVAFLTPIPMIISATSTAFPSLFHSCEHLSTSVHVVPIEPAAYVIDESWCD
ncbi:hypothetical protein MTO96_001832 [Rhipicephalus appendiculatus]